MENKNQEKVISEARKRFCGGTVFRPFNIYHIKQIKGKEKTEMVTVSQNRFLTIPLGLPLDGKYYADTNLITDENAIWVVSTAVEHRDVKACCWYNGKWAEIVDEGTEEYTDEEETTLPLLKTLLKAREQMQHSDMPKELEELLKDNNIDESKPNKISRRGAWAVKDPSAWSPWGRDNSDCSVTMQMYLKGDKDHPISDRFQNKIEIYLFLFQWMEDHRFFVDTSWKARLKAKIITWFYPVPLFGHLPILTAAGYKKLDSDLGENLKAIRRWE